MRFARVKALVIKELLAVLRDRKSRTVLILPPLLQLTIFAFAATMEVKIFTVLMGDARGYDQWARRLAAGDWIGTDVFYQAPLYPYFLGVVYAVAGADPGTARLVQAALGAASAALLAVSAARLFGARGADAS